MDTILRHKCWIGSAALLLGAALGQAQVTPQSTQQILSQMDAASARFQNAQADVSYDFYTRVVKQHELETGSIYIERGSSGESMGAVFFDAGSKTPSKVVNYGRGLLQVYSPGANQVDIFKAGANQAKYESFLTLGFGGSGTDLKKQWTIQDQGAETINGVKTEKLDLIGKDQSVRNMFSHITIWVDPVRGVSQKQIFYQPNGDMRTAVYSNIRLKSKIDTRTYEIPSKANKVVH